MSTVIATNAQPLDTLRCEIEGVDRQIVELIARRCELAHRCGVEKRARRLPVVDYAREAAVLRSVSALAAAAGLDEETVRRVFWGIIDLSRRAQLDTQ